jgi:hypothetical protein
MCGIEAESMLVSIALKGPGEGGCSYEWYSLRIWTCFCFLIEDGPRFDFDA